MKTLACVALLPAVVIAGCGSGSGADARRSAGPDDSALISDQGHNGGTAGFFFLPPTVSKAPASFTGLFDPAAAATVRVCAGTSACTDKSALAVFTRAGGTGGGPLAKIDVNTALQRYTAVWDTRQCATGLCVLTAGAAYRLHVLAVDTANTEVELGFADLQVVAKPPAPPFASSDSSLLVKGLPYAIAFRIEKCATTVCVAPDQCHVAGSCVPSTGVCSAPTAKPDGTACDDGNACTKADACAAGVCGGAPVTCTAADQCHAAGVCDRATGLCTKPPQPDGTACNDGNACTQTDTCQSGSCLGGNPVVCTIPNGTAACVSTDGSCAVLSCNAGFEKVGSTCTTTIATVIANAEATGAIPVLNHDATVPGPDANANGIRDDIDRFIGSLPDSAAQKAALTELAAALGATLSVDTTNAAVLQSVTNRLMKSVVCLHSVYDTSQASQKVRLVQELTVNTLTRFTAYETFNLALSGSTFTMPLGGGCAQ